jgi:hypothetical protein
MGGSVAGNIVFDSQQYWDIFSAPYRLYLPAIQIISVASTQSISRRGRDVSNLPSSIAEINTELNYISALLYAFISCTGTNLL